MSIFLYTGRILFKEETLAQCYVENKGINKNAHRAYHYIRCKTKNLKASIRLEVTSNFLINLSKKLVIWEGETHFKVCLFAVKLVFLLKTAPINKISPVMT